MAEYPGMGRCVDADLGDLPDLHSSDLRFSEIGDDPFALGNQTGELRTHRHIGSGRGSRYAERAVFGRQNPRVGKIYFGEAYRCLRFSDVRSQRLSADLYLR